MSEHELVAKLREALNRDPTLEEIASYGLDDGTGANFNFLQWRLDLVRALVEPEPGGDGPVTDETVP